MKESIMDDARPVRPDADDDLWEAGMRAAFHLADDGPPSVLEELRTRSDVAGVLLGESPDEVRAAIVRPLLENRERWGREGRYQIAGEIARGGIGVVLKARDVDLGRDVAMKVLHPDHADESALIPRFVEEAQIGGQLQHPGIVPVYELGLDDRKRPYFTMKLVRGRTLSALLREGVEPAGGRFVRIFEQICQTMAYAHARGVVHRDLKPANVMVGNFGEVQIIDWGFAKVLPRGGVADEIAAREEANPLDEIDIRTVRSGPDGSTSVSGSAQGTPAYMAPEQALGRVEALDERTDVFCLGAMLCEILTGQPPYAGLDLREMLSAAASGDTTDAHARLAECGAAEDLVDLARDCLRFSRSERPRDAGELAGRVSAHLAAMRDRTRAAELAAVEERERTRHERRAKRLTMGLAVVIILVLGLFGWGAWARTTRVRDREDATAAEVRDILAEAAGRSAAGDWTGAVEDALRADTRCRASRARPETRDLVARRLEEYRESERHHRLLAQIENIRMAPNIDLRKLEDAYAEAFLAYGIDVERLDAAGLAAAISAAGSESGPMLTRALDDWATRFRLDPTLRRKLILAANYTDDDVWRSRLRLAVLEEDAPALAALAGSLANGPREPESIVLLAQALWNPEHEVDAAGSLAVLREGYRLYPGDFWINFHIAMRGAQMPLEDPNKGVLHARILISLRPTSAFVRPLLGMNLWRRSQSELRREDDLTAARAILEEARREVPDVPMVLAGLAMVLHSQGEVDQARDLARRVLSEFPQIPDRPREVLEDIAR
jgi:tetratricopeptide (TPR) repeat protein